LILEVDQITNLIVVKTNDGATPPWFTCRQLDYTAARILIEIGADPNVSFLNPVETQFSYKHCAQVMGKSRVIAAFKLAGYLATKMRGSLADKGSTPLHIAVYIGHVREVRLLVRQGPDHWKDVDRLNPRKLVQSSVLALTSLSELGEGQCLWIASYRLCARDIRVTPRVRDDTDWWISYK